MVSRYMTNVERKLLSDHLYSKQCTQPAINLAPQAQEHFYRTSKSISDDLATAITDHNLWHNGRQIVVTDGNKILLSKRGLDPL